ncbi:PAS domain S-box protein [Tautonia sociabilis]|uniref:PAS domain S-box protein n=1 Tax=Tautonia sociabilis TaxID=2080755 RepID=A0A432MDE9_9BACT|nr:PAS domain S-box protein [Tautonia sociabilis]
MFRPAVHEVKTAIEALEHSNPELRCSTGVELLNEQLRREVADRCRIEHELREVQGELEERVRQRTEELSEVAATLRQSEERFRGAFEASAIGMALVGPDGRFIRVNRCLCEILGYTESELLATDFQQITHPEDLDKDLELVRQALAGETVGYRLEKRYLHKEGHVIWIVQSVSLVRDARGHPLHFVEMVEDITPGKRAEDALIEATMLRDAVLSSANFSIIATDELGTMLIFNATAERWLGYSAEEMVGRQTPELIHDRSEVARRAEELSRELGREVEPGFEAFVAKARGGEVDEGEWTSVRRDGSGFPVRLSITSLRDPGGGSPVFLASPEISPRRRRLGRGSGVPRRNWSPASPSGPRNSPGPMSGSGRGSGPFASWLTPCPRSSGRPAPTATSTTTTTAGTSSPAATAPQEGTRAGSRSCTPTTCCPVSTPGMGPWPAASRMRSSTASEIAGPASIAGISAGRFPCGTSRAGSSDGPAPPPTSMISGGSRRIAGTWRRSSSPPGTRS